MLNCQYCFYKKVTIQCTVNIFADACTEDSVQHIRGTLGHMQSRVTEKRLEALCASIPDQKASATVKSEKDLVKVARHWKIRRPSSEAFLTRSFRLFGGLTCGIQLKHLLSSITEMIFPIMHCDRIYIRLKMGIN